KMMWPSGATIGLPVLHGHAQPEDTLMPCHQHSPKAFPARSDAGEIYILLDRSGSMGARWPETLSAINGYVSRVAEARPDLVITLALFDEPSGLQRSGS